MEPPGGQPPDRDRQLFLRASQDNSHQQQQQQQQLVPFQPVKPTSLNLPPHQQLINVATSPAATTHAATTTLIALNTTLTATNTNTATVQAQAQAQATSAAAQAAHATSGGIGIGISSNATTAAAAAVAAGSSPALASTATAISATTQAATAFSGTSVTHHHQQHHHHLLPATQQQQQLPQLHHHPHIAHHSSANTAALLGGSTTGVSGSSSSSAGGAAQQQATIEKLSRPMAFDKMESLVREMQDPEHGVPVRQQKMFLTSIPYAFMGYDLIEWLMDRLLIEESEALNIANQLCLHGYFFPVNDSKTLTVKDDSSLYRFQTPYYWPWQHKTPDNVEYAIYLAKRSLRNKQRHALEDYEAEALASLHKNLKGKWEFISMQADEQVRLAKERKKGDKIVGDSQERAYWRVHRPPPGQFTPLEPCPVPSRDRQGLKPNKKKTVDDMQREVDYLKKSLNRTRMKMSQACESLVTYSETFVEYDFFLQPVLPSNPWVTEDITFWQLNSTFVDIPTEKRVKRWAISIEELVADPTGLQEFTSFLEKEYSHENIRFWTTVNRLRRSAHSQVARKVNEIYEEFLKPGAPCEINIDGKTMESVLKGLKNPSRFTFDSASEHIYMLLLKKDCYPRFIRSEHYKRLLESGIQPSHKKRFFNFGGVSGAKKKMTAALSSQPNLGDMVKGSGGASGSGTSGSMMQAPPPGNLSRRRGSDRSLTGSAHELAVIGVNKDNSSKVPHSHSQSNLCEMPYSSDTIYRGDMPQRHIAAVMDAGIYAAYGNRDCSLHTLQETPKPKTVRLETTVESTCSAVCPWDEPYSTPAAAPVPASVVVPTTTSQAAPVTAPTPASVPAPVTVPATTSAAPNEAAAAQVKLSICPWEQDPSGDSPINSGVSAGKSNTQRLTSTSSDISDVAERMQRNLGIRHQNTVDSGEAGVKRLMPNFTEQRRASVSFTQGRLSEYQFSRSGVSMKPATDGAFEQSQGRNQSSVSTNFPPQIMATLPLAAKSPSTLNTVNQITKDPPSTSDDEVENVLDKLTSSIGSELPPLLASHSVTPAQSHTTTPTPTPPPLSKITPPPGSSAALGTPIEQSLKESPKSELPTGEAETAVSEIEYTEAVAATSESMEEKGADQESDVAPLVKEVQIELIETREDAAVGPLQQELKVVVTTPTIQVQEPSQAKLSQGEHHSEDDYENQIENMGAMGFTAPLPSMASVSTNTSPPVREASLDGECAERTELQMRDDIEAPEELSPTTDEYQEGLQFGVDDKDVYGVYDIGEGDTEGGYIPPAPTPAPFMAPLAVLDVDTVDDEPCEEFTASSTVTAEAEVVARSVQTEVNITTPTMEEVRRRRKKRNSESKKMSSLEDKEREKERERTGSSGGGGEGAGTGESGTRGSADHNTVCPWEDENVTTSDGTFVKTYATLGYL